MVAKRIVITSLGAVLIGCAAIGWAGASDGPKTASVADRLKPDLSQIEDAPFGSASRLDYGRLNDRLQRVAAEPGMVGLAVAVVENGEIRFLKGYGETAAGSGEPVTSDTLFRWASLSKGVAGDMIARLAEERKLALNDPVARYSTTLRLPAGNEQKATVADVLSHQLGIFSHAEEANLESGMDARMLRQKLAALHAICPPGQCHAYQNVAFDAVSEMVEKVTGQTYQDAVRDRLFLPLGMRSANMTLEGLTGAKSWARPHVGARPQVVELTDSYYRVPAAGGVNSSIKDMALWMQAQMGLQPEVLPPDVLAAVQTGLITTPGENGRMRRFRERIGSPQYGLGWRVYDYASHKVVGHRGGVKGYRSLIMFDPVRKTGVAALWNSASNKPNGLEFEVLDMLYGLPTRDWLEVGDAPVMTAEAPTGRT